ncbi:F-box/kelch-repeat protein At3g06240-like isoform X1 [Vicia villosa]|uniref:F-box/kelch-repeat protein At3g06240-like isoform X1 n=2 Tax=Vicia villosa TaxID=3911 RepID=UPI00273C7985|nr:F-box/kelch-repeat protein At3g06240-like isoform X1 [Vicia villosa]
MMDSATVSHDDQKVSRRYIPISFYMDSAVNHPGPSRKVSKNSIPLSFYTTTHVYHPAPDPTSESKIDVFVVNEENDTRKKNPLSFYMDPTVSHPGPLLINYIQPYSSSESNSSESKIIFGSFGSESSESKSVAKVSKNYIPLSTAIPDEFAFSILSKLSIKSLKRFGCVCKSWSALFENTDFMTMYREHFISRHGSDDDYHTFILTSDKLDHGLVHSEFHLVENRLELNLPSPLQRSGEYTCILGSTSVNGFFCLGQHYLAMKTPQYVLWNPLTDEFMGIPSSPTELTPKHPSFDTLSLEPIFHGFGYDQLRHDFKVVQYVSFVSARSSRLTTSFFEIYSLKSNSWRMIDMDNDLSHWGYFYSRAFSGHEVYLDGACHWLVSECINHRRAMTVLSFDLSREVFFTTPVGEQPYAPYADLLCLTVLNGSIALLSNHHDDVVFHISILGELGVSESWIKLYTYGPSPSIQWPPLGFGKMGHLFIRKKDHEIAYVDLSTQIIQEVGITSGKTNYNIGGLYKESLLSSEDQCN